MIGFPLFSIDNRPLKVHWTTGPDPWIGPFLKIGLWDPFNKRSFDHWSILDPYENRSICLAFVGTLGLQGFPRNFNYSGHGPSSVIFFNSPLLKLCVTSFMQMWPELTYYQNAQRARECNQFKMDVRIHCQLVQLVREKNPQTTNIMRSLRMRAPQNIFKNKMTSHLDR